MHHCVISKNCKLKKRSLYGIFSYLQVNDNTYDIAERVYDCDVYKCFLKHLHCKSVIDIQEIMFVLCNDHIYHIDYILLPENNIKIGNTIFKDIKLHFMAEDITDSRKKTSLLENEYKIYIETCPAKILLFRKIKTRYKSNYNDIIVKEITGKIKKGQFIIKFNV